MYNEGLVGGATLAPGRYVFLEVSDTGHGIPADIVPRIFEPFYTTKHQGTGLGMAIAKRIVEAHGGEIHVGPAGPGAEMVLLLPGGSE